MFLIVSNSLLCCFCMIRILTLTEQFMLYSYDFWRVWHQKAVNFHSRNIKITYCRYYTNFLPYYSYSPFFFCRNPTAKDKFYQNKKWNITLIPTAFFKKKNSEGPGQHESRSPFCLGKIALTGGRVGTGEGGNKWYQRYWDLNSLTVKIKNSPARQLFHAQ